MNLVRSVRGNLTNNKQGSGAIGWMKGEEEEEGDEG